MPWVQECLDEEGRPALVICGQFASEQLLSELLNKHDYPIGPDEHAIVLPFETIAEYAMQTLPKALSAEMAKQESQNAE